jgi:hypothetical protein
MGKLIIEENNIGDEGCSWLAKADWPKLNALVLGNPLIIKWETGLLILDVKV